MNSEPCGFLVEGFILSCTVICPLEMYSCAHSNFVVHIYLLFSNTYNSTIEQHGSSCWLQVVSDRYQPSTY